MTLSLKESLQLLAELNETEVKISETKERLLESTQKQDALSDAKAALEKKVADKQQALLEVDREKNSAEQALLIEKDHLNDRSGKLNALKTQREYQASAKELDDLKRMITQRENTIISLLEEYERGQKNLEPVKTELEKLTETVALESAPLVETQKECTQTLKELERIRNKTLKQISPELLEKYNRIAARKTPAVAFVQKGACQECFIKIPSQLVVIAQLYNDLVYCPSCYRMLYAPPKEVTPQPS